jgi:iron complex outermembrane receptor protein
MEEETVMGNGSAWRVLGIAVLALCGAAIAELCLAQEGGQAGKEAVKEEQQAQPKKEEPAQPKKEEEAKPVGHYVEEMIVTAEKRPEDIQKIPVAVSTLSGQDLGTIFTAGPDIRAISGRVPSLVLESSFGRAFPRFYMRGLGNSDFDLNASQPVSMVVDDVVMENPIVKGMPLWDLDRVEVLRGPQGTLFGRNTDAGVIKFESTKPSQTFESNFRGSYGSYNNIDFNGGIGGPLSETLSARFSVLSQTQDNWVDNKWTGYKGTNPALGAYQTTAYRLQFLWEPSKNFSGLLNLHGWDVNGTARIFRANIIKKGSNDFVPGYKQDVVYQDGQNAQKIHSKGAMLRLVYDFGPAALTSVTGYETLNQMYSRGDIDGGYGDSSHPPFGPGFIPFYSETADGIPSLGQVTEELRLASNPAGPFQWLLGAYYFRENVNIDSYSYTSVLAGNPQEGFANQTQTTKAYALFGSVDYDWDKWAVKAGVRYSNDKKDFAANRPWPVFQTPTVRPITEHTNSNNVSWDLSGTYKANPNLNVYGKLATGYRGPSIQGRILFCADFEGGTNPATNCVSVAKAETIKSAEIGVKSILADQRLRLNLAAYVYQMSDQQLTAVGGRYNTATLLNAKRTDGHGFEADVEYIPSPYVIMSFGVSYNPTKIDDPGLTVAPCGGGCTVTNRTNATPTTPASLVYVNGNSLPFAPDWIFSGVFNVQSDPYSKGYFGSLDWAYSSDKSFFLYESKEFHSDSLELGLRLGYGWNGDKYEVALFARNLLDKKILQGGIDFDNLTGMTNEPRIIGVEFNAKF